MKFVPITESRRRQTLIFLARYEHTCCALVERVRRRNFDGAFALVNNAGKINGVVSVKGTMLHCLPDARFEKKLVALKADITDFLRDKNISCVNGEESGSLVIMNILEASGKAAKQINYYTLMTPRRFDEMRLDDDEQKARKKSKKLKSKTKRESHVVLPAPEGFTLSDGFRIIVCGEQDCDALMPLQSAYEIEEVIPAYREFSAAVTRKNLEHTLLTEYVIALQNRDGALVAKANTNAIGMHYAQIGGVYTFPEWRKNHYAAVLVRALCERIERSKRRPVLYARNGNEAAKALYASLGFRKSCGFVIAYY